VRRVNAGPGVPSAPTWSPDGQELAFSLDGGAGPRLMVASLSRGPRAVATGFTHVTDPDWSPDGSRLAFTVRQGGRQHVAVLSLVRGVTRILAPGHSPAWGANSRHLILSTGSSLVRCDTETGQSRELISGMGQISEPTWTK
jgi:TolB protein